MVFSVLGTENIDVEAIQVVPARGQGYRGSSPPALGFQPGALGFQPGGRVIGRFQPGTRVISRVPARDSRVPGFQLGTYR